MDDGMSFTAGKTQSQFPAKLEIGKPHQEQSQTARIKHMFYACCPQVKRR